MSETAAATRATRNGRAFWLSLVTVLAAAVWVTYQGRGTINNDGILYLNAAWFFAQTDWASGVATYNWPLYTLLVAGVHGLTGLSLQTSAHLIDIVSLTAAAAALFTLVQDLGGGDRGVKWAAILLLATPYLFGDVVPMILRDHAFWACHLWSLVFLSRFMTSPSWRLAASWGACALVAVLFRIEGITYLLAAPLVLLLGRERPLRSRIREFALANVPLTAVSLVVLAALLHPAVDISHLGRLGDPVLIAQKVGQQLASGLGERAEVIATQVLGRYLDDFGMAMLLLGMVYIMLAKAVTASGLLQTLLAVTRWQRFSGSISPDHRRLLLWLMLLGLLNGAMALLRAFIMPGRLLIPVGFLVIAFAALSASRWVDEHRGDRRSLPRMRRFALPAAALLLIGQLAASLKPSSPALAFEIDAVDWARARAGESHAIYYQTPRLAFYGGQHRSLDEWSSQPTAPTVGDATAGPGGHTYPIPDPAGYAYLVFVTKEKERELNQALSARLGDPVAVFDGPRGRKQALVFSGNAIPLSAAPSPGNRGQ